MIASRWIGTRAVAACAVLCLACAAPSQEISWRTDYTEARKEAVQTGRPLFIDFTTDNCLWCQRLEAQTFSRPEVAKLINESFIPLKVHAGRTPQLANALNIQLFPTMLFAAPEGKILGVQEGFVEAAVLKGQLEKVISIVAEPAWMVRDYQKAVEAQGVADYSQAISLLRNILEDGKTRRTQVKARTLLDELEKQADGRLAEGKALMDKGKDQEAKKVLDDLTRLYAGTPAAATGKDLLATIVSRAPPTADVRLQTARELLQKAREDYRTQQFLCCLDRCEVLIASYSDLPEGLEASRLAAEIKGNADWTRQACDQLSERLGVLYLALAESWLKKGQPQQAVYYLERIIQILPNTRHAEMAQVRLAQIQGQPPDMMKSEPPK